MQLRPVILCGGSGTRLWPLSRGKHPKQFMDLDGESLFGRTLDRLADLNEAGDPLVVCNEEHRFFAAAIAQAHNVHAEFLLEPEGRNTAPAITLAALAALEADNQPPPDPVLLILPSDHKIEPLATFHAAVRSALTVLAAEPDRFMTFGIPPTRAETGFGYLIRGHALPHGGFAVDRFVEKPDRTAAEGLLRSGNCAWNSGIFLFRARAFLAALKELAPAIYSACTQAWDKRRRDTDFVRPGRDPFLASPANSIDYAVMERVPSVGMIELSASWSDLGSWEAFYDSAPHDASHNAVQGDVIAQDTSHCYLHATHRLIAAIGIHNLAVVETADAVLVLDRSHAQDVKILLESLKIEGRSEADTHVRVFRPWGSYEVVAAGRRYQVKKITVRPGAALSLQLHHHRAEHWVVVAGTAKVTVNAEERLVTEDQAVYIPLGVPHRLENPGRIPLELIEVQSGSYLGEDDIVRFEDCYGRIDTSFSQNSPTQANTSVTEAKTPCSPA